MKLDYYSIINYLKQKEIPCIKYNYSLDKEIQNSDQYFATLTLSRDGKKFIVKNLKPNGYFEEDGFTAGGNQKPRGNSMVKTMS